MFDQGMTAREKVLAALNREPAPLAWIEMLFHRQVAEQILGHTVQGINAENAQYADQVALCEQLGLCGVGMPVYARFGSHMEWTDQSYHWIPHILDWDDLPKLKIPPLAKAGLLAQIEEAQAAIGDRGLAFYPIGMFCVSASMNDMGFENFCLKLHDDPRLVRKVMEAYVRYHAEQFEFLSAQPGVDFLWVFDDIAFKTSTFFSPRVFRREILPIWREAAQCIRKPWIFHSDGNLEPLLDDLLTLGMSAIHPLENGAMDIFALKKSVGQRVALVGNVDMGLLTVGEASAVEEAVLKLAGSMTEGGGYILSSGNSISNDVSARNLLAMGQALRSWNASRLSTISRKVEHKEILHGHNDT